MTGADAANGRRVVCGDGKNGSTLTIGSEGGGYRGVQESCRDPTRLVWIRGDWNLYLHLAKGIDGRFRFLNWRTWHRHSNGVQIDTSLLLVHRINNSATIG